MIKRFTPITFCLVLSVLFSLPVCGQWVSLLDKDMSQWQTYLSYKHQNNYNGNIPKSVDGKELAPVGYDKDPSGVFSVIDEPGGLVLRVSGEMYGCVFTKQDFENYHLKLQFKWGKQKYEPRVNKLKDTGILYHSTGPAGAEYWRTWMLSQEFQIMEGHMGDYWCQANSVVDIRSFPSEGVMSAIADEKQPYRTYKSGA
ncbi:MAG TPA: family 16 glycoside hydrolase, partial [Dyadobacter sp.]|nr:family 16 glycoside hydrolase [Dyadobacter sp.]